MDIQLFGVCKDTESSIGYAISVMAHRPGGQSYSEWSIDNKSTFSPYFEALDAPFTIAGSAAEQFKNVNVGSNGNGILSINQEQSLMVISM